MALLRLHSSRPRIILSGLGILKLAQEKAASLPYRRGRQRVYALCLDKRGRIVSEGANSYVKTHPVQKLYGAKMGNPRKEYLHAEICALIRAYRNGSDVKTIVVGRVGGTGKALPSKPCAVCQLALEEAGIENIIYE